MNWRRIVPLAAGVLVLGTVVAYWFLEPRVAVFSPTSGTENARRDSRVEIEFTQPMRAETVLERVTILPEQAGTFEWEGNTLVFAPNEPWPQGVIVSVELEAGARSRLGLPVTRGGHWSFGVAPTLLAYLWPAGGAADIYALDLNNSDIIRLTDTAGVLDFDVNSDGTILYYSVTNAEGGSDLYALDRFEGTSAQVLDCGADACSSAQVRPDGSRLAFERLPAEVRDDRPEIWVLELESGETERVSTAGHEVRYPRWSPKGLLSYYDVEEQAFMVVDLDSGESRELKNDTGEAGTWSASGQTFVAPEYYLVVTDTLRGPTGEAGLSEPDEATLEPVEIYSSHLLAYDLDTGRASDLTRSDEIEDAAPSFSPDGNWLAYGRKYLDEARRTPGRQLWVIHPDGSGAQALTNAGDFKYSDFSWHPESGQIAVVRFDQIALTQPPEIWLLYLDGSPALRLVIGGYAPQWVP